MPMMKIGSHSEPELDGDRADVDALGDQHDRERDGQQIDGKGPEHVEDARQHHVDDAAEEAGDQADERREDQVKTVAAPAISSELQPAIEQPRHHVAALVVGAEEIVAESQVGPIGV